MTVLAADPTTRLFDAAVDAAADQLEPLRDRAIHVSGASGFLAANLLALLSAADRSRGLGLRLYASARRPASAVPLFRFLGVEPDVVWEIAPVEATVLPDEPGLIAVHAASPAAPADYLRAPLETFRANTDGVIRTFDEAQRVGAGHVVFISSAEVYGQPPESAMPTPEAYGGAPALLDARSIYGESKRMGEVLAAALSAEHGLPFTAARPWNLFGPGQRLDDGRVPMEFMRLALAEGAVTLASDGTPQRCPCFVWDGLLQVVSGLAAGDGARAFNVGNAADELTMLALARACARTAGLDEDAVRAAAAAAGAAGGLQRCVPDVRAVIDRATPALPPTTPLDEALAALRAWVTWLQADG